MAVSLGRWSTSAGLARAVRIWSAIRFGVSPTINAIGTLMMVVSLTAVAAAVLIPRLFGRKESGIKVLTGQEGG